MKSAEQFSEFRIQGCEHLAAALHQFGFGSEWSQWGSPQGIDRQVPWSQRIQAQLLSTILVDFSKQRNENIFSGLMERLAIFGGVIEPLFAGKGVANVVLISRVDADLGSV